MARTGFTGWHFTAGWPRPVSNPSSPLPSQRSSVVWAILLVLAVTLAAYHNSLSGPLILDDVLAISHNSSIRQLWPPGPMLSPPAECTVAGRPLANISFALNYALGGTAVRGYHAVNLGLHAGSALLLLGLLYQTFARTDRLRDAALVLATVAAGLWAAHPLLTAAVSYISQRTEVLMTFCYLATLYAFVRATGSAGKGWWVTSVVACWCGMASKEGMVTAPVLVLLYDRVFIAGSFRAALRARWRYYGALAASWILLGFLLADLRSRAVGFGLGVSWWRYALTECEAIATYLRLIVWPHPLIFDYGAIFLESPARAAGFIAFMALLIALTLWLGWRRPRAGFALAAFLILLAPTSSVVPVSAQPIAENRVYLASAPIVALIAVCGFLGLGRLRLGPRLGLLLGIGAVVTLSALTIQRNTVLGQPRMLWEDTVAKRPANPRAATNLGEVLFAAGDLAAARVQFENAVRLKPDYPEPLNNLGVTLHRLGDPVQATEAFAAAVRIKPDFVSARNNLGNALLQTGRLPEAQAQFEEALRLAADPRRLVPELPELLNSLGTTLLYQGKTAEALGHYERAVQLRPDFLQARMNWGVALRVLGRLPESQVQLETVVRAQPDSPEARFNLGLVLVQRGDAAGGEECLREAVRLKPDFAVAHQTLGDLASSQGKRDIAHAHYSAALKANPSDSSLQQRWQATAPVDRRP